MITTRLSTTLPLIMASLGMFMTTALAHEKDDEREGRARSQYCGDGTFDSIVGQYVGAHDDGPITVRGTNPNDLTVNAGGGGVITEVAGLGAGAEWATGGSPFGTVNAGINVRWRNIGNNTYSITAEVLGGNAQQLPGTSAVPPIGVFPTTDFQRAYARGRATLSNHCRTLNMAFNVCFVTVQNPDSSLSNLSPCVPTSSDPLITLIYNKLELP